MRPAQPQNLCLLSPRCYIINKETAKVLHRVSKFCNLLTNSRRLEGYSTKEIDAARVGVEQDFVLAAEGGGQGDSCNSGWNKD